MVGYLRKLKWISILETRQKSFQKRVDYFNLQSQPPRRGSYGKRIKDPCWSGKVGLYGAYISFELDPGLEGDGFFQNVENDMEDRYGFKIKDSLWIGENPSKFIAPSENKSTPKSLFVESKEKKESFLQEKKRFTNDYS